MAYSHSQGAAELRFEPTSLEENAVTVFVHFGLTSVLVVCSLTPALRRLLAERLEPSSCPHPLLSSPGGRVGSSGVPWEWQVRGWLEAQPLQDPQPLGVTSRCCKVFHK